jgi:FkbM family methyltransferase
MKIEEKRKKLIKLIEEKEKAIKEYCEKNYDGPGWIRKIRKLLKYKQKYLSYALPRLIPKMVRLKTFWGNDFFVFLSANLPLHLFGILGGDQEVRLTKFLIKHLPENVIFYDIGAFCGYYSALVKEIIERGEIHAFEPISTSFRCLQKNISSTDGIKVFLNNLAISNKEGEIDFYTESSNRHPEGSTLNASAIIGNFKKIKVKTTTLDSYCSAHQCPNFMKIDVEGAEEYVIEGGMRVLKETSPIIAMEVWRKPLNNKSHLKAMEILYKLGYKSYKINDQGELIFKEKIVPEEDILMGTGDNFIFKK